MANDALAPLTVGYFGPATTNTHAAALAMFGPATSYQAFVTIAQVFEAVGSGAVTHGVVPLENSTEGIVRETLDCLITERPLIEREHEIEIRHCLMARPGLDPARATAILSHPQALAQCRLWLDRHYPDVPRISATSTAAAARDASRDGELLAIASQLAAETYGLVVLEGNLADNAHNATRFVGIALQDAAPSGQDKTSLVFRAAHERGALRAALGVLDDAGVNMTRIESRPLPERRWEYAFVVEVEGHRTDAAVERALGELERSQRLVKVLGSYPRDRGSLSAVSPS